MKKHAKDIGINAHMRTDAERTSGGIFRDMADYKIKIDRRACENVSCCSFSERESKERAKKW